VGEGDREEPCHYTQTAAACLEGMGRESERERERERDGVAAAAAVTGDGSCRVSNDPDHHRPHLKKTLSLLLYIHTYDATCI